jgi:hypothetical protein
LTGKPGAKCPENNKSIPLISNAGSACVSCGLCVYGKADIRFSATKKWENKMAELKYFNALMNSVVGNDEERKAAKEYLAEVDPEVWGDSPD